MNLFSDIYKKIIKNQCSMYIQIITLAINTLLSNHSSTLAPQILPAYQSYAVNALDSSKHWKNYLSVLFKKKKVGAFKPTQKILWFLDVSHLLVGGKVECPAMKIVDSSPGSMSSLSRASLWKCSCCDFTDIAQPVTGCWWFQLPSMDENNVDRLYMIIHVKGCLHSKEA